MQEKLLIIINSIKNNKFEEPVSEIKPEQKLREDLNFDSFDLAELTVKIEEEFGVDIFEDGLGNNGGGGEGGWGMRASRLGMHCTLFRPTLIYGAGIQQIFTQIATSIRI